MHMRDVRFSTCIEHTSNFPPNGDIFARLFEYIMTDVTNSLINILLLYDTSFNSRLVHIVALTHFYHVLEYVHRSDPPITKRSS